MRICVNGLLISLQVSRCEPVELRIRVAVVLSSGLHCLCHATELKHKIHFEILNWILKSILK